MSNTGRGSKDKDKDQERKDKAEQKASSAAPVEPKTKSKPGSKGGWREAAYNVAGSIAGRAAAETVKAYSKSKTALGLGPRPLDADVPAPKQPKSPPKSKGKEHKASAVKTTAAAKTQSKTEEEKTLFDPQAAIRDLGFQAKDDKAQLILEAIPKHQGALEKRRALLSQHLTSLDESKELREHFEKFTKTVESKDKDKPANQLSIKDMEKRALKLLQQAEDLLTETERDLSAHPFPDELEEADTANKELLTNKLRCFQILKALALTNFQSKAKQLKQQFDAIIDVTTGDPKVLDISMSVADLKNLFKNLSPENKKRAGEMLQLASGTVDDELFLARSASCERTVNQFKEQFKSYYDDSLKKIEAAKEKRKQAEIVIQGIQDIIQAEKKALEEKKAEEKRESDRIAAEKKAQAQKNWNQTLALAKVSTKLKTKYKAAQSRITLKEKEREKEQERKIKEAKQAAISDAPKTILASIKDLFDLADMSSDFKNFFHLAHIKENMDNFLEKTKTQDLIEFLKIIQSQANQRMSTLTHHKKMTIDKFTLYDKTLFALHLALENNNPQSPTFDLGKFQQDLIEKIMAAHLAEKATKHQKSDALKNIYLLIVNYAVPAGLASKQPELKSFESETKLENHLKQQIKEIQRKANTKEAIKSLYLAPLFQEAFKNLKLDSSEEKYDVIIHANHDLQALIDKRNLESKNISALSVMYNLLEGNQKWFPKQTTFFSSFTPQQKIALQVKKLILERKDQPPEQTLISIHKLILQLDTFSKYNKETFSVSALGKLEHPQDRMLGAILLAAQELKEKGNTFEKLQEALTSINGAWKNSEHRPWAKKHIKDATYSIPDDEFKRPGKR